MSREKGREPVELRPSPKAWEHWERTGVQAGAHCRDTVLNRMGERTAWCRDLASWARERQRERLEGGFKRDRTSSERLSTAWSSSTFSLLKGSVGSGVTVSTEAERHVQKAAVGSLWVVEAKQAANQRRCS